jgi:hypothetical protein
MREAQDYLRVAKPTIYILAKGQLAPAVRRVGGHLRLDRDVLLRIIEGGAE